MRFLVVIWISCFLRNDYGDYLAALKDAGK